MNTETSDFSTHNYHGSRMNVFQDIGKEQDELHNEVLITTDGSQYSQIAAILASQIAEAEHLRVRGLYVVNMHYILDNYADPRPELGDIELPVSQDDLIEMFKLRGEKALKWLGALCNLMHVPFQYEVVFGYVAEEIVRQTQNAKLVAFGKKGFHKPGEMSHLGENFYQFIHQIHAPFIASNLELRLVRNILLGFNGSIPSTRALRWAEKLAETFQAKIYIAYVDENGNQTGKSIKQVKKEIQDSHLQSYEWILLKGDPIDQLAKAAINYGIDLLIVGRSEHTLTADLFKASNLDRLLRNIQVTTLFG
jgi:nucleotide-binding universal stress UspA family protein